MQPGGQQALVDPVDILHVETEMGDPVLMYHRAGSAIRQAEHLMIRTLPAGQRVSLCTSRPNKSR